MNRSRPKAPMKSVAAWLLRVGAPVLGRLLWVGHTFRRVLRCLRIWGVSKCTHLISSSHFCYVLLSLHVYYMSCYMLIYSLSLSFIIDHDDNLIPPWTSRWWLPPIYFQHGPRNTCSHQRTEKWWVWTKCIQCPNLSKLIEPICSMYGTFTYIYHKFRPNVGKYTIRWASG